MAAGTAVVGAVVAGGEVGDAFRLHPHHVFAETGTQVLDDPFVVVV